MNNELIIYKNEAYLLEDTIKERFYKKYNNLILGTTLSINNDLLEGIHIKLVDNYLKVSKSSYINLSGIYSTKDYIDYIFIKITEMLVEIVNAHYYK